MSTECNTDRFCFQPLGRREVVGAFDGGPITSDAGGLLLREVEQRTGILRQFAACFVDHRDPELIEHTVLELVAQRIYALALGYEDLNDQLRALQAQQQPVLAVVACACSTPIGAFDRLEAIADVCRRYGIWLHVDAAHGGAACLSPRYRPLVAGLDQADSLIWDAHKMLFAPALCAFVFYRQAAHRFEAFRQDAPYLFDPAASGLAEFDSGLRTVECTKRAAAFGLWGLWSLFGRQLFTDLVDTTFGLGRVLYEKLAVAEDFVPLHEPQCNIVVFRHLPAGLQGAPPEAVCRFQLELRRWLIECKRPVEHVLGWMVA